MTAYDDADRKVELHLQHTLPQTTMAVLLSHLHLPLIFMAAGFALSQSSNTTITLKNGGSLLGRRMPLENVSVDLFFGMYVFRTILVLLISLSLMIFCLVSRETSKTVAPSNSSDDALC